MARISATVDDSLSNEIDTFAAERKISRAQWIVEAVIHFRDHIQEGGSADTFAEQIGTMNGTIADLQQLLEDRDHEIMDLKRQNTSSAEKIDMLKDEVRYLRGENSKLTDKLTPPRLPEPQGFWGRLFGRHGS